MRQHTLCICTEPARFWRVLGLVGMFSDNVLHPSIQLCRPVNPCDSVVPMFFQVFWQSRIVIWHDVVSCHIVCMCLIVFTCFAYILPANLWQPVVLPADHGDLWHCQDAKEAWSIPGFNDPRIYWETWPTCCDPTNGIWHLYVVHPIDSESRFI